MPRRLPRRVTKHFNADILLADLQRWRGTPEVGEEIAKAKQHSDELYKGFYKQPAADIYRVVKGIFEGGGHREKRGGPRFGTAPDGHTRL